MCLHVGLQLGSFEMARSVVDKLTFKYMRIYN
jgi:hypothetical protein